MFNWLRTKPDRRNLEAKPSELFEKYGGAPNDTVSIVSMLPRNHMVFTKKNYLTQNELALFLHLTDKHSKYCPECENGNYPIPPRVEDLLETYCLENGMRRDEL